jgi:hypothetical protein
MHLRSHPEAGEKFWAGKVLGGVVRVQEVQDMYNFHVCSLQAALNL